MSHSNLRGYLGGRNVLWVGAAILAFALACGVFATAFHDEAYAAAKKRVVDFWVYASPERVPLYEKFFDAFEKKTGIHVNFVQAPAGQVQKWEQVIVRIAGGVSPDVVGAVSVEFVQYAAQGLIRPVDELLKQDKVNTSEIIPILRSALQWRGKQYMMPYGASGLPLACNVDLFEERGIQPPPKVWGDPSWNWRSFVDAMVKLTVRDASGKFKQFGLAYPYWDSWITLPYNWGGEWVDEEFTRFLGDQPEAIASVQSLQDLKWRYHVMPQPGESADFLKGTAALAAWGTWGLEALRQADRPFRLTPWFQVEKHKPLGAINPMGLALISSARHPEEAWEFIKFATTDPEGNLLFAQAAGAVPGVVSVQREWAKTVETGAPNARNINALAFVQQVVEHAAIINIRRATTFTDINTIMTDAVNAVLNNAKSAEQAMREVAPRINALIKQGRP